MLFKTGKHAGKSTEEVLLKVPDFAQWMITNHPEAPHSKALAQRMRDFDKKPFTEECHGRCGRKATGTTAYRGGDMLFFWCDQCSPSSSGADPDKLNILRSVRELLAHIDFWSAGNRDFKRRMVRRLAEAKGLPKRVGKAEASDFFS